MNGCIWLTMIWVLIASVSASPSFGQYLDCKTNASTPDDLLAGGLSAPYVGTLPEYSSESVRVYVHILREDDGSGGLSQAVIDSLLEQVYIDFSSVGVYLVVDSQSNLNNSTFYANPDSCSAQIFATNSHTDGVDIYLGPFVGTVKAGAQGIPSTAAFMTGAFDSYHALSHSLGHCFGLYDTHETIFGASSPGSSSGADGDLVSDTYADPGLNDEVLATCELDSSGATSGYVPAPDPSNIMSGGRTSCWEGFTVEQGRRMLNILEESSAMGATVLVNTGPYDDFTEMTDLRDYYIQTPDPAVNEHSSLPLMMSNAASFDYNLDGMKDVVISGHHHGETEDDENRGFVGMTTEFSVYGVPVFSDVSDLVFHEGNRPPSFTTGIIMADYDNDGRIDFYAPNPQFDNKGRRHRLYRNDENDGFVDVTASVGLDNLIEGADRNDETVTGTWVDYNGDGFLDLLLMTANSDQTQFGPLPARSVRLYKNVSGGTGGARTFVDVTSTSGIGMAVAGVHSALWADFDQDHDVDLVLVGHMDDGQTLLSKYYENLGNGTFSDSTTSHLPDRADWLENHGLASVGDFDNDADLDVVYHSQLRRAWYANDYNDGAGSGQLHKQWFEEQIPNTQWEIEPSDLNVFDYDLDGDVDFSIGNYNSNYNDRPQYLYSKSDVGDGFSQMEISSKDDHWSSSFGMCAADINLDGYTELVLGTTPAKPFFYKAMQSYPSPATDWVGIRLETLSFLFNDYTRPCNFRGIGATVTVSYGNYRQARLVDGGSGGAGQNDLDLSFGVPGAPSEVYVDISWPCGQDQRVLVPTGTYTTVYLGWPVVDDSSAGFDVIMTPGESDVAWEFTWETDYPGDDSLDMVEFMTGAQVPLPPIVQLTPSSDNVDHEVTWVELPGDPQGKYLHKLTLNSVECVTPMTVQYRVSSGFANSTSSSNFKSRRIFICPLAGP